MTDLDPYSGFQLSHDRILTPERRQRIVLWVFVGALLAEGALLAAILVLIFTP